MISFKQHLLEVFDKPLRYAQHDQYTSDHGDISFTYKVFDNGELISNVHIYVRTRDDNRPPFIDVNIINPKPDADDFELSNENKYQFRLYATVYAIMRDLRQKNIIPAGSEIIATGWTDKQDHTYHKIYTFLTKKGFLEKSHRGYKFK